MTTTSRAAVIESDMFDFGYLTAGAGWDLNRGFFLPRVDLVTVFGSKAEATRAARSIGWDAKQVEKCYSRFMTKGYALHSEVGGFLTHDGFAALLAERAAEHSTRTFQRQEGERYVSKSNGSCGRWRPNYVTTWVCSCGNGGFGEHNDRASARRLAKQHREKPEEHPGQPWVGATLARASVA